MKGFLFDENVPIPLRFTPSLPALHATSLEASPSDQTLWDYAKESELVIVSKDTDFSDRAMQQSPPPWVVHLKFGNLRRHAFDSLLAGLWPRIESLLPVHKLIRVYTDRIEAVRE